jgi:hypothetical protein
MIRRSDGTHLVLTGQEVKEGESLTVAANVNDFK